MTNSRTNLSRMMAFQGHPPIQLLMATIAFVALLDSVSVAQNPLSVSKPESVNSVAAEMKSFALADGYQANLFADETDGVANPVCMSRDPGGRLWVLCTWAYPQAKPVDKPDDKLLILTDTNVGRVVAALEQLGVADNTIILFTSDNGGESNNRNIAPTSNVPLRAGKGWNYEGGIRVPTFVTWPGHIAAQERDERVITMDIYPTLLELAELDAKPQQHLDGRSLVPLIEGKEETVKRPFLAWRKPHQRGASRPSAAIIKDDWKLIHYLGTKSTELYNLDDDPGEANNLAASEAGKSSELLDILNDWSDETEFKKPKAAAAQTKPLPAKPNTPRPVTEPHENTDFFSGKDLVGWQGNDGYWSVKDNAIVGHSEKDVPKNEFIWSDVEVKDFLLVVDVKLTPDDRNAGIQFRSKRVNAAGQAIGYQADVGASVWGKLYHEHGRGKLDWNDNATGAVKPGEWNRYEILAVGDRIWTAINGKLCVAIEDPQGERAGKIAFQIHGGPPQTVHYRNPKLTHNPKIELAGLNEKELIAKLPKRPEPKPVTPAPISTSHWPKLIAAVDPGSQNEVWAKPAMDHSQWKTMQLPGHFDTAELPGFDGVVWFRKTIELTEKQAQAAAILHLGQIDDMDVSWVNGTRVGGFEDPGHHYTLRHYPVAAGVLQAGKNVIAVRVMDHGAAGGIAGKPGQLALQLGDETLSLANQWHLAPGASLAALNQHAAVVGPKPGWNAEVTQWRATLDANDPGIKGRWYDTQWDDSKWKTIKVPGHYEGQGLPDFDGTVWFRRTLQLPEGAAGKDLALALGPIDDMDMTFFNGELVGGIETPGFWAANRGYQVPGKLVKAGRNVLTVRVMDHGWLGGFTGSPARMKLAGSGIDISLAGRWRYAPGVQLKTIGLGPLTNPPPTTAPTPFVAEVSPLLRPLVRPETPVPAFGDRFLIDSDQTIVILGGTNAFESSRHGYLETLLTAAHPEHKIRVRNLAWQADTVYQQQRPRNFFAANKPSYGERDGRQRIAANIVFFWMGQTESLDGPQRVEEFINAYSQRLDEISAYTQRIVLVTPVPLSNPLRLDIDLAKRRQSHAAYVDAIRKMGRERKLPVVDLGKAFGSGDTPFPHSRNGLHLLPAGHWAAAQAFASELGFAGRVASIEWFDSDAALQPASAEKLRQAIGRKNDLWFSYWRPTNWAFLYGNRQTQPSSRDHTNSGRRWFPEELQKVLPQLDQAEQRIHHAVQAAKGTEE